DHPVRPRPRFHEDPGRLELVPPAGPRLAAPHRYRRRSPAPAGTRTGRLRLIARNQLGEPLAQPTAKANVKGRPSTHGVVFAPATNNVSRPWGRRAGEAPRRQAPRHKVPSPLWGEG